ncbi:MAG: hypothetical protein WCG98_03575 [bacterium]
MNAKRSFLLLCGTTFHLVEFESLPYDTLLIDLAKILQNAAMPLLTAEEVSKIEQLFVEKKFSEWYSIGGERVFAGRNVELIACVHVVSEKAHVSVRHPEHFTGEGKKFVLKKVLKSWIPEFGEDHFIVVFNE